MRQGAEEYEVSMSGQGVGVSGVYCIMVVVEILKYDF